MRGLDKSQRKKLFTSPEHLERYTFDTCRTWMFCFHQHLLDLSSFTMDLSVREVDVARHLNGQPLLIMAKTREGEYLWNFQMFHERLLAQQEC